MTADEVMQILNVLLFQFNIPFDKHDYQKSSIFTVSKFGLKIVYLDGQTFDNKVLSGWNIVYIHPDYTVLQTKEKIVWGLVKGGYFHYLRNNYNKTFKQMLFTENWGKFLIKERIRRYKELPKYNYFGEINKDALNESEMWILSRDPGFFDFMLEE
jgi:hypothetical protein